MEKQNKKRTYNKVWLLLVFLYIVGATGYIFIENLIAGIIMLVNLAIFLSLVYQHHQRTGVWQLPLRYKSFGVSAKDIEANTTSKCKSNRYVNNTPPFKHNAK
jgi:hypothetical protein